MSSHEADLRQSLQRIHIQQQHISAETSPETTDRSDGHAHMEPSTRVVDPVDDEPNTRVPLPRRDSAIREGYGFRPPSGASTPLREAHSAPSPLPDPNGLGWPGMCVYVCLFSVVKTRIISSSCQQRA
jgi:GTP cyclohydrolase IA